MDDFIVTIVLLIVLYCVFSLALILQQRETIRQYRRTITALEATILRQSTNPDWQAFFDQIQL